MKALKKYRTIVVLAVLAVLMAGIYIWMETTDDASVSGTLYRLGEGETITSISIDNLYGQYDFAPDGEGRWTVTADGNTYRTHTSKMELITTEGVVARNISYYPHIGYISWALNYYQLDKQL